MLIRRNTIRPGLTLVEVLVSAALCILIMTVIAFAFQQGMDTFSLMKSTGDLQSRLRAAELIIRDDLKAEHLESDYGPRVADQRLDLVTPSNMPSGTAAWTPPKGGYFRLFHGSALNTTVDADPTNDGAYQLEGQDSDGLSSTRATNHVLQMTVRRPGTTQDQAFYAGVRPQSQNDWNTIAASGLASLSSLSSATFPTDARFASRWAEVTYFLDLNAPQTTPGGVKMYPLYRRIRVVGHKQFAANLIGATADLQKLAPALAVDSPTAPTNVYGPSEAAKPANRFGGDASNWTATSFTGLTPATDTSGFPSGADVLLTNVISFEVKAVWDGTPAPGTFSSNTDTPFDILPAVTGTSTNSTYDGKRLFDTWWQDPNNQDAWRTIGTNCVPQFIRLKAVQIKVRVYDPKNQIARQIMIVQNV
jgi:hypothetical protein